MKFIQRSLIVLAGITLALTNVGSAFATQPGEGTAFDSLKRGCQSSFPLRRLDTEQTRIVVVEKSTFCLFVLQKNRRGRVVASLATATSLGYDLRYKNGKYEVVDVALRAASRHSLGSDIFGPQSTYSPESGRSNPFGIATIRLLEVVGRGGESSHGHRHQFRRSLLIHGVDDPLNVGGLIWDLPGVSLLDEDARTLANSVRPGVKTYVVDRLSDIGL